MKHPLTTISKYLKDNGIPNSHITYSPNYLRIIHAHKTIGLLSTGSQITLFRKDEKQLQITIKDIKTWHLANPQLLKELLLTLQTLTKNTPQPP